MEGRILATMFLFMIIMVASPSPSSCARLNGFPTTYTLRDDGAIGYYGDQVAAATSNSFHDKEYGDVFATPNTFKEYYRPLANRQTDDDLQAFPDAWRSLAKSEFNVMNYGAVGNGQVDDTQAFLKAWGDVCGSTQGLPALIIPKGNTFLLNSVEFKGPCKAASVNFQLSGNIVAPNNINAWKDKEKWIQFYDVEGLIINGGGQIDGQGEVWWKVCDNSNCQRPTSVLHIYQCDGLRLSDITHINSPRNHIFIMGSNGVQISDILIRAPDESPNTDGIKISRSTNINIHNSFIGTGDDCIAIISGSSHINITNVMCGPGHGISVGSLGKEGAYNTVEDVQVRNCTLKGTDNGARIKTWQGGSGYARNISFEDIIIQEVKNPIIIDQKYIDKSIAGTGTLLGQGSAVKVSDVTFRNIRGSVAGETAITLDCDDQIGCKNIVMDNIDLTSSVPGKKVSAQCKNVQGFSTSLSPSVPCL
ncbi:putative polygalacturonase [Rosa chinensis]|uniref:Putative polygalacturonase n=1 Tax=Rosa chinensis TaxID=74649 RepID=A0A2P6SB59_ROSCH|nr:probable polygalacturonase At3g15720 isoform X1 [Rosa chinensis]PRQ55901.1 putative polygalacturonase [Rosa chinensis]